MGDVGVSACALGKTGAHAQKHKPSVVDSSCAAPGCCNSESSFPPDKGQRVKWKSKQAFLCFRTDAVQQEASGPCFALVLINVGFIVQPP